MLKHPNHLSHQTTPKGVGFGPVDCGGAGGAADSVPPNYSASNSKTRFGYDKNATKAFQPKLEKKSMNVKNDENPFESFVFDGCCCYCCCVKRELKKWVLERARKRNWVLWKRQ